MPRLAICSGDLHWQWINWAPLYDTMEVSMLRLTWLTVAQHVFQPALTGRLELISRKIVSCEPGTKAITVSRFREKLSPANWVQGVTVISRKISRSWAPKNGVQHATTIYPIPRYTRPRYIGLTLYLVSHLSNQDGPEIKVISRSPDGAPETIKLFHSPDFCHMAIRALLAIHSLQWRHNERDGISNHQTHYCLLNCLLRHRSKKMWELCVTGLCEGNSPVTGEFPSQKASNAENVSIWWHHHVGADSSL